jgi:DNA-binding NtrC family response regulator
MEKRPKALIVDDDPQLVGLIHEMLSDWGYRSAIASHGEEAVDLIAKEPFDLVLADVMMPGMSGLDLLRQARQIRPDLPFVIMTGFGNIEGAVQAIQAGAANYITKPFPMNFLKETLHKVLARKSFQEPDFAERVTAEGEEWSLVTQDPTMKKILKMVENVAQTSATLLIQGETGTGKELMARYLHLRSPRKKKPFLAINCAAIPKDLLESELFGHEKGAFTGALERKIGKFEAANGGTLLLDEIGEMDLEPQAKILRVLEEKEFFRVGGTETIRVDTRVIAATNKNLKELVKLNRFREDLFYRLNVIPVLIPPLRERKNDIPLLVQLFLRQYEREHQLKNVTIEPKAVEKLKRYPWPGNIRELDNVLLRAAITAPEGKIREEDLFLDEEAAVFNVERGGEAISLDDLEKQTILEALRTHHGNRTHAARALGISLRTLRNKIRQYREEGVAI